MNKITRLTVLLPLLGLLLLPIVVFSASGLGAGSSRPSAPTGTEPPTVILLPYVSGVYSAVDITHTGVAGDERLFVVQKAGQIMIVENGAVQPTAFLNIDSRVLSSGYEQGLLGLTFDPDYAMNGHFYVNYTYGTGDTRISRFTASDPMDDTVDPGSELILMDLSQPFTNHNGGGLDFGSDGYLYIALGDGGSAGDPGNRAQTLSTPLGKILRIDVHAGPGDPSDCEGNGSGNYTIPADNPFGDGPGGDCDEIWAWGLRNPWRISFDRSTGDLYIGDVGQDDYEEIDYQTSSSTGGENYGWRCYEGPASFISSGCGPSTDYVFPVAAYDHGLGGAVTGGYVYRGAAYPEMDGNYFFADFISGRVWSMYHDGLQWRVKFQGRYNGRSFSTFGEDINGELYVADMAGNQIYRIHFLPDLIYLPTVQKN